MDDTLIENLIQFFPFFLVTPYFHSQLRVKYCLVQGLMLDVRALLTIPSYLQGWLTGQVTLGLIYVDWEYFSYSDSSFLCYKVCHINK